MLFMSGLMPAYVFVGFLFSQTSMAKTTPGNVLTHRRECWADRGCGLDKEITQTPNPRLSMPIVNRVADLQPDIQAWRRDIHQHPELLRSPAPNRPSGV